MSISLAFRFLAGRYHATPSGHHVNEGLIEWPPSPWRLVRALVSVGYTSGAWDAAGPPETARRLLGHLTADLPHYSLPAAVGAHSRHYMPVGVLDPKTKVETTKLVFDTWARVADQELVATWPNVVLDHAERAMLVLLTERLNYLGRSESWVEGRVMEDGEQTPETNCFPEEPRNSPGRGWEQTVLLVPESVSAYATWRAARLEETLADLQLPEERRPTRTLLAKQARAAEPYPDDLLDCLQKDTTWLRSHGWNRPPGSRRVFYWRPVDAVSVGAPETRADTRVTTRVRAMLLSLTNARRNDHALPLVIRTLPQAELLHRALVGISARNGVPPPELTGRMPTGGLFGGRMSTHTSIRWISMATGTWTMSWSGRRAASAPKPKSPFVQRGRRSPRVPLNPCAWVWRRRVTSRIWLDCPGYTGGGSPD